MCSRLPLPQHHLALPPAVALSALQVPAPCAPWQKEGRGPFGISSETLQLGDWRKQSAESLEERQKRVTVFLPTESPLHTPSWHPTACGGMSPRLPHSMLPPAPVSMAGHRSPGAFSHPKERRVYGVPTPSTDTSGTFLLFPLPQPQPEQLPSACDAGHCALVESVGKEKDPDSTPVLGWQRSQVISSGSLPTHAYHTETQTHTQAHTDMDVQA